MNWQNDTCYCNFEVDLNMNFIAVISKCTIHDHMGDIGAFNSALARNNQSNQAGNSAEAKFNMRKSTK